MSGRRCRARWDRHDATCTEFGDHTIHKAERLATRDHGTRTAHRASYTWTDVVAGREWEARPATAHGAG